MQERNLADFNLAVGYERPPNLNLCQIFQLNSIQMDICMHTPSKQVMNWVWLPWLVQSGLCAQANLGQTFQQQLRLQNVLFYWGPFLVQWSQVCSLQVQTTAGNIHYNMASHGAGENVGWNFELSCTCMSCKYHMYMYASYV